MKKIMAVALALFVFAAFSFVAACQKKEEPKAPAAPAGGEPAKEAPAPEKAPEAPAKK
jgi:hypothetical protein